MRLFSLKFYRENADNCIKQARLCDVRIESILLGLIEKESERLSGDCHP